MKFPPDLTSGATVSIVSPAGQVDPQLIERGAAQLRDRGLKVRIGRHALDHTGVFAGTDEDRAADMQEALDDPTVEAVFFSRGGYGCLRTHLRLDWSAFLNQPKWLVGFSDATVFHSFLASRNIATVHGVMTAFFEQDGAPTASFLETIGLLEGKATDCTIPAHPLNRPGTACGILTGGNLSIIQSLRGTPLDLIPAGRILFIEDIQELNYRVDRIMQNLKVGGILEQLSGLIVGHLTGFKDGTTPYDGTACDIIREAVEPYTYPVAFAFPAGHELPNHPLLMGGKFLLDVTDKETRLENKTGPLTA